MAAFKCILAALVLATLATVALATPPYKMVADGTCEDIGMETITDVDVCLAAGIDVSNDPTKTYAGKQPEGGYQFTTAAITRGCVFASGDTKADLQFFPTAKGACGVDSYHCVCGSKTSSTTPTPSPAAPAAGPVPLGTAGDFVILTKSGISTVPTSDITGDIGVSPIASAAMTGFSLAADSSNTFSTSTQIKGKAYAADYAPPTPSKMTTAISDMETAYTDAAGRISDESNRNIKSGLISGMTFTAGVYKWDSDVMFSADIYIKGSSSDHFVFQTTGNVIAGSGAKVVLVDSDTGGGKPQAANIVWQVAGYVDAGTTSHLEGVVLGKTYAAFKTGSSLNGRVLAQTACTLDTATIKEP